MTLADKIVVAPGSLVVVWSALVLLKGLELHKRDDRRQAVAMFYGVLVAECFVAMIFCGFVAWTVAESDRPVSHFFKWLLTSVAFGVVGLLATFVAEAYSPVEAPAAEKPEPEWHTPKAEGWQL